ncbi:hypothetical protein PUR_08120 [Paenibacillus sp. URB8-2]|nr:hypothetical protein PUR_08120 [Paenibacillus sp. URB8-2]
MGRDFGQIADRVAIVTVGGPPSRQTGRGQLRPVCSDGCRRVGISTSISVRSADIAYNVPDKPTVKANRKSPRLTA